MKTYKFKMYSNHGNGELHKTIDGHAEVWNHCIALQRRYYAIYGKHISKFRLINHIFNNIYRVGASTLEGEDVRLSSDSCPC